jgi:hypothetical protein
MLVRKVINDRPKRAVRKINAERRICHNETTAANARRQLAHKNT